MSDAARLRAQKAYSTDPEYLERMALHEEAGDASMARKEVEKTADVEEVREDK